MLFFELACQTFVLLHVEVKEFVDQRRGKKLALRIWILHKKPKARLHCLPFDDQIIALVEICLTDIFEHVLFGKGKIMGYLRFLNEIRYLFLSNLDWEIVQTVYYSS